MKDLVDELLGPVPSGYTRNGKAQFVGVFAGSIPPKLLATEMANACHGYRGLLILHETLANEYVIELTSFGHVGTTRLSNPRTWTHPAARFDMENLCNTNSSRAIAIKPSLSWPLRFRFVMAESIPASNEIGLRWDGESLFFCHLPIRNEPIPIQPTLQPASLDSVLARLYDSVGKATKHEVDSLLAEYKKLTGKDRPGFMR